MPHASANDDDTCFDVGILIKLLDHIINFVPCTVVRSALFTCMYLMFGVAMTFCLLLDCIVLLVACVFLRLCVHAICLCWHMFAFTSDL